MISLQGMPRMALRADLVLSGMKARGYEDVLMTETDDILSGEIAEI